MVGRWVSMGIAGLAAGLLVACSASAPGQVSETPTASAAPVTPGAPAADSTSPAVTSASPMATRVADDLAVARDEAQCPTTDLTDFQACDGALCIRAASMVTRVNERHKILWLPQNGFTGTLAVLAERYGGGTVLRQTLERASSPPEPNYPSVWQFPTAGCWRLTATAGEETGSVVVWVQ